MTKPTKTLAIGLIFLSIFIFFEALNSTNLLLKISGILGSLIIFISELIWIWRNLKNG